MAEKAGGKFDRVPPQAPDIERAIIGAMLIDHGAIGTAVELVKEEFFYKPVHAMIFRALTDLYDDHVPIDQLTVTDQLKRRGQLDMIGGEITISSIIGETASSANIRYHCNILKEKALLRNLITITSTYNNKCYDETANSSELLDNLEGNIMQLSEMRQTKSFVSLQESVNEAHAEIVKKSQATDGLTGVDTGFSKLNNMTAGWQPSDLVVLAGRPSMGKTALALDFAKNAASKGVPVGIFSLEMSSLQLVMRMLFNEGRFDGSSLQTHKPKNEDWTRLLDACNRLHDYPMYIDDTPGLSIMELTAKAKRLKAEKNIGLLMIDYLQLMQGSNQESRQQEISAISRSLKGIAKELNIPVIALSQLSRALEQRGGDRRPILSDLRESGAIEQDADIVMFIYRAAVYNLEMEYEIGDVNVESENVAELIIRKQRNGPIGTVLLHWIKEYTKFNEFSYSSSGEFY